MESIPAVHLMPTMKTSLGTLVVREREARGWTQRDVAERGGISHVAVGNIERGGEDRRVETRTLWGIATAFATDGTTVNEWFTRLLVAAGYPPDASPDAAVAKLAAVLSDKHRRVLLDMSPDDLERFLSLYESAQQRARGPSE